jgi:hypothetical protein
MVVIVAFVAAQLAATVAVLVADLANDPELNVQEWADGAEANAFLLSIGTIATACVCVPLVRFLAGRREQDPWRFLGASRTDGRTIGLWSLGLVALGLVSDSLTVALGRPVVPEFMSVAYASATHPLLLFVALVFFAPAFEEIFFRGFVLGSLQSSGASAVVASVVTSLAWSVIHLQYDLYGIATIFVLGMFFAMARLRTGSILTCLVLHGLQNAIAFAQAAYFS